MIFQWLLSTFSAGILSAGGSAVHTPGGGAPPPGEGPPENPPVEAPFNYYDGVLATIPECFRADHDLDNDVDNTDQALLMDQISGNVCVFRSPNNNPAVNPKEQWAMGPPAAFSWFPIGVWDQPTANIANLATMGFNTFVKMNDAGHAAWIAEIESEGVYAVPQWSRDAVTIPTLSAFIDSTQVIAWMPLTAEQPDDACVVPATFQTTYDGARTTDPHRPMLAIMGRELFHDSWDRGACDDQFTDYPLYMAAADFVAGALYPVSDCEPDSEVCDNLWYINEGPRKTDFYTRFRSYADTTGGVLPPYWAFIETKKRTAGGTQATIAQIESMVWMSLIYGARGIVYRCDDDTGDTDACHTDATMRAQLTTLNAEVNGLAQILNAGNVATNLDHPEAADVVWVKRRDPGNGQAYFLTASHSATSQSHTVFIGVPVGTVLEVVGESRTIVTDRGSFTDTYEAYESHIYRIQ
jgi:hypothetical protein